MTYTTMITTSTAPTLPATPSVPRHLIVGDVHGCGLELERLIAAFDPSPGDQVVLVGDLFDRALHADRVWEVAHRPYVTCVMGNHDHKMLSHLRGERKWLPLHYSHAKGILHEAGVTRDRLVAFLEAMPLLYTPLGDPSFVVAHAAVDVTDPLRADVSTNVYGRLNSKGRPRKGEAEYHFWESYTGTLAVLYGHLVTDDNRPRIRQTGDVVHSIGLDTAACHGGGLTGYCPEEGLFYQCPTPDYFGPAKAAGTFKDAAQRWSETNPWNEST